VQNYKKLSKQRTMIENRRKTILLEQKPFTMLIFSSLGVFLIGLVFQLLGILLAILFYDVSAIELLDMEGIVDAEHINAVKFLQIIGALGTFVFSSFLISFFYTGSWTGFFTFGKTIHWKAAILLILIMLASLPLVNLLTDLNLRFQIPFDGIESYFRKMEEQTESMMMTLIRADNIGGLLLNLFMIAIIPAVGEELVFRGLIQKHLTDLFKNGHVAIIVASIIFSLAHFQIYSFLPRFFLGMILGYTFYYGKSLWYPMLAHLVNNSLGVIFYYFYMKDQTGESIEEIGTMELMPVTAIASLVLVAFLMFIWVKIVQPNQTAQSGQL
jgi:hypothetical protein